MGVGKRRGQKKKFFKKNKIKKIERQKVVKFMKRKSQRTCQSYSLSPRSAKQISESFSTNRLKNKRNFDCTLCKPRAGYRKLDSELLFLKKSQHS